MDIDTVCSRESIESLLRIVRNGMDPAKQTAGDQLSRAIVRAVIGLTQSDNVELIGKLVVARNEEINGKFFVRVISQGRSLFGAWIRADEIEIHFYEDSIYASNCYVSENWEKVILNAAAAKGVALD